MAARKSIGRLCPIRAQHAVADVFSHPRSTGVHLPQKPKPFGGFQVFSQAYQCTHLFCIISHRIRIEPVSRLKGAVLSPVIASATLQKSCSTGAPVTSCGKDGSGLGPLMDLDGTAFGGLLSNEGSKSSGANASNRVPSGNGILRGENADVHFRADGTL